jgi:hypothetical protein
MTTTIIIIRIKLCKSSPAALSQQQNTFRYDLGETSVNLVIITSVEISTSVCVYPWKNQVMRGVRAAGGIEK